MKGGPVSLRRLVGQLHALLPRQQRALVAHDGIGPSTRVDSVLAEIDADPTGIFWA
jgi:hypothetical protein